MMSFFRLYSTIYSKIRAKFKRKLKKSVLKVHLAVLKYDFDDNWDSVFVKFWNYIKK